MTKITLQYHDKYATRKKWEEKKNTNQTATEPWRNLAPKKIFLLWWRNLPRVEKIFPPWIKFALSPKNFPSTEGNLIENFPWKKFLPFIHATLISHSNQPSSISLDYKSASFPVFSLLRSVPGGHESARPRLKYWPYQHRRWVFRLIGPRGGKTLNPPKKPF